MGSSRYSQRRAVGASGPQGPAGSAGAAGSSGASGKSGYSGPSGFSGIGSSIYTVNEYGFSGTITLTEAQCGDVLTNYGSTGGLRGFNLPAPTNGWAYVFACVDSHGINVKCTAGSTIRLNKLTSGDGGYLRSYDLGAWVELIAVEGVWYARDLLGDWTVG